MKTISIFICVVTFILCAVMVSADQCIQESSKCSAILANVDQKETKLFCKKVQEAITCMNTAWAKCSSDAGRNNLKTGKEGLDQQKGARCKNGGGATSTHWSGLLWFMVVLLVGGFVYV